MILPVQMLFLHGGQCYTRVVTDDLKKVAMTISSKTSILNINPE